MRDLAIFFLRFREARQTDLVTIRLQSMRAGIYICMCVCVFGYLQIVEHIRSFRHHLRRRQVRL